MKKMISGLVLTLVAASLATANPYTFPYPQPYPQPQPQYNYDPVPPSGLMLGVRVFENWKGLRVISTIPGEAANGVLMRDDIILRMALPNGQIFNTHTLASLEHAKDVIGPGQTAAIEIDRPGWGLTYFYVSLRPVGGGVAAYGAAAGPAVGGAPAGQMRTEIRRSGEAARMFNGAPANNGPTNNGPIHNGPVNNGPVHNGPVHGGPASLFGQ